MQTRQPRAISHMKTVTLGPFLGINNRLPNFALHVDGKGFPEVGRERGHRQRGSLAIPSWGDVDPGDDRGAQPVSHQIPRGIWCEPVRCTPSPLPTYTETLVKALSGTRR